jgi:hypothetical protein
LHLRIKPTPVKDSQSTVLEARANETEEQLRVTHNVFGVNLETDHPLQQLIMTFLRAIIAGCR